MDTLSLSDEDLVSEFLNGSLLCFDEVLSRYESKLFYFLKTLVGADREAEEGLQELAVLAFTRFSESLATTHSLKGSVKRWLFAQAISIAKFKVAASRRDATLEKLRMFEDYEPEGLTLEQSVELALAQLSFDHRLAFLLWDVADFALNDVALLAGETTFESRLKIQRARLGIRKLSLKRRQFKISEAIVGREKSTTVGLAPTH